MRRNPQAVRILGLVGAVAVALVVAVFMFARSDDPQLPPAPPEPALAGDGQPSPVTGGVSSPSPNPATGTAATPQPNPAEADRVQRVLAAFGYVTFVQVHELGHALLDLLDLPAVGPEEDVVDEFATITLMGMDPQHGLGHDFALAGAQGFLALWKVRTALEAEGKTEPMSYWDEHSLDIQRFHRILCLLYGARPDWFGDLARAEGLSTRRLQMCEEEAAEKARSWGRMLAPHVRAPDTAAPGARITVSYAPTTTGSTQLPTLLRNQPALETLPSLLSDVLVLPSPIHMVFTDCGEPNAFWDPSRQQIVICYEMIHMAMKMFGAAPFQADEAGPPPPLGPSSPQPPGPADLVGVWRGQSEDPLGFSAHTETTLGADGRFVHIQWTDASRMLRLSGRYEVWGSLLRLEVSEWHPTEFCGISGCRPVQPPARLDLPFSTPERGVIETPYGRYQRVQ